MHTAHLKHVINGGGCEGGVWLHVQNSRQPHPPVLQPVGVWAWFRGGLQEGSVETDDARHSLEVGVLSLHLPITTHLVAQQSGQQNTTHTHTHTHDTHDTHTHTTHTAHTHGNRNELLSLVDTLMYYVWPERHPSPGHLNQIPTADMEPL